MHPKLITKLTVITSLMLLLGMLLFAYFNLRTLRQIILEKTVQEVDHLSETLIRSTHYQMLEDDRKRVYQMIQEVGSTPGIELIRLINKDGMIIFSTRQAEIGRPMNKETDHSCQMCHTDEATLTHASSMNRSRVFRNGGGEDVLGMVRAIYNQESCATAACHFHAPETKLLGVLDIIVSLDGMRSSLRNYRNDLLLETLILLISLCLCLTLVTQKTVHQPLRLLLGHTRALARGEWPKIEMDHRDEFGELAEAFDEMTASLRKAREELEGWATTLEAKVEERTLKIREMQSELIRSEKLASLGELVAGIAHEINNPLTGILMLTSMLAANPRLDPALTADLETIIAETQRCSRIVRELLNFSRESVPRKGADSLNRILDRSLSLVENQASFLNIRVERLYDPALPLVPMDADQMQQVFINILINASQAMPDGGDLVVRTGFNAERNKVFASIRDSGCGIPQEHAKKIFDPFFTTKGHLGTGLGLSVSYGIIENHGGQIEVQSRPGDGSTFIIRLPVEPPTGETTKVTAGPSADSGPPAG